VVSGRVYLDASAAVKLVVAEPESQPLAQFLAGQGTRVSHRILEVELTRAVRGCSPDSLEQATALLRVLEFIELDAEIAGIAGGLEPSPLRSLDAIHLASALALGGELDAFVTYDARQADAARALGLTVEAPS
jgi:predicted nucleic acid-binding protein